MKIVLLTLFLAWNTFTALLLTTPPPRKLLLGFNSSSDTDRFEGQQAMLIEQSKQVKSAFDYDMTKSNLDDLNEDTMNDIYDRYLRTRAQRDYVKNFLNNKMDDVYNNFIGIQRWFY